MDLSQALIVAPIGLAGGLAGGMLGIGGSVVVIPLLTFAIGPNQHLYQSAALIANLLVASSSALKHRGKGTIRGDLAPRMLVVAGALSIAGVFVSNLVDATRLMAVFGGFLIYLAANELVSMVRSRGKPVDEPTSDQVRIGPASPIAGLGGFAAGLLGIGGGVIMIPLLRKFARIPLRQCIATSAVVMLGSTAVGALAKNMSVSGLKDPSGMPLTLAQSLTLAGMLAPTALVGGYLGAGISYRLPLKALKVVFAVLLAFAGARMVMSGLR
ncbi:MAG: sulfite exporter TauE/SafE family protein [Phycisphaerales bacterium]